jgi:transcriptional regulator GlxA family with amidase domain
LAFSSHTHLSQLDVVYGGKKHAKSRSALVIYDKSIRSFSLARPVPRQIKLMQFGVFIYDGTEPIDLATYGVLSMARRIRSDIQICTLAPRSGIVQLSNGLRVIPDYDISSVLPLDVLIVTGGPGWQEQSKSADTLQFIRSRADDTLVVSVCTGSLILAASGVLNGKAATTKREVVTPETPPIEIMRAAYPEIDVYEASLVAGDRIITGGGVSLCIDATLYLLQNLFGREFAK